MAGQDGMGQRPFKRARSSYGGDDDDSNIDPQLFVTRTPISPMDNIMLSGQSWQFLQDMEFGATGQAGHEEYPQQIQIQHEDVEGGAYMDVNSSQTNRLHFGETALTLDNFDSTTRQENDTTQQLSQYPSNFRYNVTSSQFSDDFDLAATTSPSSNASPSSRRLRPEAPTFRPRRPPSSTTGVPVFTQSFTPPPQHDLAHDQKAYDRNFPSLQQQQHTQFRTRTLQRQGHPNPVTPASSRTGGVTYPIDTNFGQQNVPRDDSNMLSPAKNYPTPTTSSRSGPEPYYFDSPTPSRQPTITEGQISFYQIINSAAPRSSVDIDDWRGSNPNRTHTQPPNQTLQIPHRHRHQRTLRAGRGPPSQAGSATTSFSYECSSEGCDKSFVKEIDLRHHERYHNEEGKVHCCPECPKTFFFNKDLERHVKVHSKDRPFLCNAEECQYKTKGFPRRDQVKRHVKKVHPGIVWREELREEQAEVGATAPPPAGYATGSS